MTKAELERAKLSAMDPRQRERYRLEQENARLRQQIAEAQAAVDAAQRPRDGAEMDDLARLQSRADSVAAMFGDRAPSPMPGEKPGAFRLRLLQKFQRHSPDFKDFDFARADSAIIDLAEPVVYQAAEAVGRSGDVAPRGLVKVEEKDSAGRTVTKFYGNNLEWMAPFMSGGQVVRIERPGFGQDNRPGGDKYARTGFDQF
jgi:hypothetical protein